MRYSYIVNFIIQTFTYAIVVIHYLNTLNLLIIVTIVDEM